MRPDPLGEPRRPHPRVRGRPGVSSGGGHISGRRKLLKAWLSIREGAATLDSSRSRPIVTRARVPRTGGLRPARGPRLYPLERRHPPRHQGEKVAELSLVYHRTAYHHTASTEPTKISRFVQSRPQSEKGS